MTTKGVCSVFLKENEPLNIIRRICALEQRPPPLSDLLVAQAVAAPVEHAFGTLGEIVRRKLSCDVMRKHLAEPVPERRSQGMLKLMRMASYFDKKLRTAATAENYRAERRIPKGTAELFSDRDASDPNRRIGSVKSEVLPCFCDVAKPPNLGAISKKDLVHISPEIIVCS